MSQVVVRTGWMRAHRRPVSAALFFCVGMLLGSSAMGYVFARTDASQTPIYWAGTNCVQITPTTALTSAELAALQRAAENWNEAIAGCSYMRIQILPVSATATLGISLDGVNTNVIAKATSGWPRHPGTVSLPTSHFYDEPGDPLDGQLINADILLNMEFTDWTTSGEADKTDLENVLTQQLGHVLGLAATCVDEVEIPWPMDDAGELVPLCTAPDLPAEVTEATMFSWVLPGETKKRSPEADDVAGLCVLYPIAEDPGVCAPVDLSDGGDEPAPGDDNEGGDTNDGDDDGNNDDGDTSAPAGANRDPGPDADAAGADGEGGDGRDQVGTTEPDSGGCHLRRPADDASLGVILILAGCVVAMRRRRA